MLADETRPSVCRTLQIQKHQAMKLLKWIACTLVVLGSQACESPVTFTVPQPDNTHNLDRFPHRLQGEYLSLADSSTLSIGNKLIRRSYSFVDTLAPNKLDSTYRVEGDTLINLTTDQRSPVWHLGDSLVVRAHFTDTLFQMNYDNVVRKMKGYYFLNTRQGQSGWEVEKLRLSNGRLTVGQISTKQDLDTLQAITESPADTVPPYQITATKRQFRKFVRAKGFSDQEVFVRRKADH